MTAFGQTRSELAAENLAAHLAVVLTSSKTLRLPDFTGERCIGITDKAYLANYAATAIVEGDAVGLANSAINPGDLLKAIADTGLLARAAAAALMDSDNANSDITFTVKQAYQGHKGNHVSVTFTDPAGNNQALAVTVSNLDINVSLATGGAGAISSTAADIVAAIAAHAAASLLVAGVADGTGLGVVKAIAKTYLTGGNGAFAVALEAATAQNTEIQIQVGGAS